MPQAPTAAWYLACRAADLKRRPLALTVDGRPLVLFRAANNRVAGLDDRCAHRAAPLSKGCVDAGRLRCPYHGWVYDGAGAVVEIPALPAAPPEADLRVRAYPVVEQQGFVWIALGDGARLSPPHHFAHLGETGWTSFVMQTRFDATVEACLENFLDCPHATFVHRYWFRAPTGRPVRAVVRTLEDGAQAEFFEEPRKKSVVWALLAPRKGPMRHVDRFIAPSTSQVDYAFENGLRYSITSACTPVAPNATQVTTVISFRWPWLGPVVRLFFEPLSRLIIRQDVRMLAAQQANVERFDDNHFASTPADLLGPHIAAWRRALRSGAVPPPAGSERVIEIRL